MNRETDSSVPAAADAFGDGEHPAGNIEIQPRTPVGLRATALLGAVAVGEVVNLVPFLTFGGGAPV